MKPLEILELFGGIGACSKALERLGIPYHIADYVEIDKYAVKSFNAIHNTNFEPQDICEWNKDINVDLIMHGSPCQDFSATGLGKGGVKGSGTRSSLIYETIRIVEKLKPKYVVWENVKNVLNQPHIQVVNDYIEQLNKMGYVSNIKLTTASYYGIPQERQRVICISILNGERFEFPEEKVKANNLEDYIDFREEDDLTFNFYRRYKEVINDDATIEEFEKYIENLPIKKGIGTKKMGLYTFGEMDTITMPNGRTGTLTCRNVQNYNKKFWYNKKLYKPSPKMCWLLMGFDEDDFIKASQVNDDKALYNQAGNSIVVNVLEGILSNLLLTNSQEEDKAA
jgi:DNA (cytosine-5)-methyltransferase 1